MCKSPFSLCDLNRCAVAALLLLPAIAGCQSQDAPITSESSEYEVADPSGAAPAQPTAPSQPAAPSQPGAPSQPATAPPTGAAPAPSPPTQSPPGDTPQAARPPVQPPPRSQDELDEHVVPDGTPQELWAFIQRMGQQQPRGRTQSEMIASLQKIIAARIEAAEKILANEEAPPELRRGAVEVKLGSLQGLHQMGVKEARQHMLEFSQAIQQDQDASLALFGRLLSFNLRMEDHISQGAGDYEALLAELKTILAEEEKSADVFQHMRHAALELMRAGQQEQGQKFVDAIVAHFQSGDDEQLRKATKTLGEQALVFQLDFERKRDDFLKGKEGALDALQEVLRQLLQHADAGEAILAVAAQAADDLERNQQFEAASETYALIGETFADHAEAKVAEFAKTTLKDAEQRLALVGSPLTFQGSLLDGSPLDWNQYKDKVVLVTFWSANSVPSLREIGNIKLHYDAYHADGLEVIGVNIDADRQLLERFFAVQQLPWATVVDFQDGKSPIAAQCGVSMLPFTLLINRQGNVAAIHVGGAKLKDHIQALLEGAEDAPPPKAEPDDQSSSEPLDGLQGDEEVLLALTFCAQHAADQESAEQFDEEPAVAEDNPYSPRPGLSPSQLVDFIFNMEEKPKSIQVRPGFAEAIVEAADRILAAETKQKHLLLAAEAKFRALHAAASRGNERCDEQLMQFVAEMKEDTRPRIASQVKFYLLERKALGADDLPLEEMPGLLSELKDFFAAEKPTARHLRMASATVHIINRLEDEEQREAYFKQFGGLFAKATDKQLARYGKQLASDSSSGSALPDVVGKALELAGTTDLGTPLDWASYRGKVVLIDFWATWCGPCVRDMPHLAKFYQEHQQQGFDVLGVNLDKDADALARFLDEHEIGWTNLVGEDARELARRYEVRGIPTMMLVDGDAKVVAVSHKLAELLPEVEKRLAQQTE